MKLKYSRLEILKKFSNFIFIKDLSSEDVVNSIFQLYNPEIVVNLAAQAGVRYSIDHPKCYIASNIMGFFNILEACGIIL